MIVSLEGLPHLPISALLDEIQLDTVCCHRYPEIDDILNGHAIHEYLQWWSEQSNPPNQIHLYQHSPYVLSHVLDNFPPVDLCQPDVIIYLHSYPSQSSLYLPYEIILDNLNCPIPIYKVNASDKFPTILQTVTQIVSQLDTRQTDPPGL